METQFLRTLIAVAELGSVAAAARGLGLTATSVTQRLHALEAELGTKLVLRAGREMRLTPAGDAVLERARRVVAEVEALARAVPGPEEGALTGTIRLGAISTALTGLLPQVIGLWARVHPAVVLSISPGTSATLYDGLVSGVFDAVIAVEPPFILPKTVKTRVLRREKLLCLAPAAASGGSAGLDDARQVRTLLEQERFIRYDVTSWGGRLCEAYLRHRRIRVREFCSLDALEAIALLVEQGVGVALVPDWSPPWPAVPSCTKISIPDAAYARTILLAHPAQTRHSRVLDAFADAVVI